LKNPKQTGRTPLRPTRFKKLFPILETQKKNIMKIWAKFTQMGKNIAVKWLMGKEMGWEKWFLLMAMSIAENSRKAGSMVKGALGGKVGIGILGTGSIVKGWGMGSIKWLVVGACIVARGKGIWGMGKGCTLFLMGISTLAASGSTPGMGLEKCSLPMGLSGKGSGKGIIGAARGWKPGPGERRREAIGLMASFRMSKISLGVRCFLGLQYINFWIGRARDLGFGVWGLVFEFFFGCVFN
jgi:hypothetical protein